MGLLGDAWDATGGQIVNAGKAIYNEAGDLVDGAGHIIKKAGGKIEDAIYQQNAPSAADSVDAVAIRDFATKLREQYANLTPQQAQQIAAQQIQAQKVQAQQIDPSQANQARAVASRNLEGLETTANGGPTAADSLLRAGTDAAAHNATGLAASLSASNPGLALERGIAGSNDAYARAAAVAGQQKANEVAQARSSLGSLADSMRGADIGAATTNANLSADAAARNQAAELQAAKANQDAALAASKANQESSIQQQQVNNQNQQANAKIAADATTANLPAQINNQNEQQKTEAANTGTTQGIVGGVVQPLADFAVKKLLSDERAKTNVKRKSLADEYADKIHGVSFQYKPGMGDGGEHVGVLAQDVEKAVPGAVAKDASGMKSVDIGHLTAANAAALADIAGRLRRLEGKRG